MLAIWTISMIFVANRTSIFRSMLNITALQANMVEFIIERIRIARFGVKTNHPFRTAAFRAWRFDDSRAFPAPAGAEYPRHIEAKLPESFIKKSKSHNA